MRLGLRLGVLCCVWGSPVLAETPGEGDVVDATAEAQAAPPPTGEKALVSVRSTGDSVTVAKIVNRTVATGYAAGGGTVIIAGIQYKDLCTSPCTLKLDSGFHELMVYGSGMPAAAEKFDFGPGKHELEVNPGSNGLVVGGYILSALGITALIMGGVFLAVDADSYGAWALPTTIGGAVGTGVGIGMMLGGGTSFERVSGPGRVAKSGPSLMLGYRAAL